MITVSLFLHHVWGVALAADATFITVSGVNEEMMFIRHRASQTLLLSNVLTVHRDPLSTETRPHLAVHLGEAVYAHEDALSRATILEIHRRAGTLPASFRYPFQNDIDLLNSELAFNELSRSYELSIGKFLPPNLSRPEYSYESNKVLFNRATELRIHWDDDDASMLHFIFDDFKSPMTLPAVTGMASNSSTVSVLDVKIHCFKQHSRRVFLCHFIDANKKPYGRPLVMKLAWSPILEEYEEVIEFSRVVETPEIDHEFETLERLADGDPDVACRVPKPYGHFSGDVKIIEQPYKFSAYFVEDCAGCYPIGIADEIDADLCITVTNWLKAVHTPLGGHLLHNNLSRENILFKPSDPTCFYVVGWQKASTMEATGEEECVEWEDELLKDLLALKKHHVYDKRARHDSEDEDVEDAHSQIESISNEYEDVYYD
ncbi:hypothetical protein CPB85DRAFT_460081 [Mucidula mucida]|nr:hypothetical protein CPB85DRAFT_460081 [Mucidula mucida]